MNRTTSTILAMATMCFVLRTSQPAAAVELTVGTPTPAMTKLAGKALYYTDAFALFDDDLPQDAGFSYMMALLQKAGVTVERYSTTRTKLKPGDFLLVVDPAVPALTAEEKLDPLMMARKEMAEAKFRDYMDSGRAKLLAAAKEHNATVIEASDAAAFFGLDEKIFPDLRRYALQSAARNFEFLIPEVKFKGVALTDGIDFLRDVTGQNILVDWRSLEQAGINKTAPLDISLTATTFRGALDELTRVLGKDKLVYLTDGSATWITTPKRAKAVNTRRPGAWLTVEQLTNPPAEALAGEPLLPANLRRRLPDIHFDGNALSDIVDFMRDVTGAKIRADWDALDKVGVAKDAAVSLTARNIPTHRVLRLIAAAVNPTDDVAVFYVTKTGECILTSRAAAEKAADKQTILEP